VPKVPANTQVSDSIHTGVQSAACGNCEAVTYAKFLISTIARQAKESEVFSMQLSFADGCNL